MRKKVDAACDKVLLPNCLFGSASDLFVEKKGMGYLYARLVSLLTKYRSLLITASYSESVWPVQDTLAS